VNLKKIIKETIDDTEDPWSWAKFDPVEPRKKSEIRVGDVYTIYGNDHERYIRYQIEVTEINGYEVVYEVLITSDEEEEPTGSIQSTEFDNAKRLIKDNYWVLTSSLDGNLNESEEGDEWGWTKGDPTLEELIGSGLLDNGDKIWVRGYTKINSWDSDEQAVYIDSWFIIEDLGSTATNTDYSTNSEVCDILKCNLVGSFIDVDEKLYVYKIEKANQNLKESEEEDVWDWVKKHNVSIPITELKPNDEYKIIDISGLAWEEYMRDNDLNEFDPYTTIFKMDDNGCFWEYGIEYTEEANENTTDVYIRPIDKIFGGWINVNKIIVTKVNTNTLTENKKKKDGFDWARETNPDIKLEPNTLYYFEPNIGGEELKNFTKRFAPGYKALGRYLGGLKEVKYFVTDETGKKIQGWCYFTPLEEAMEFYENYDVNYVDVRERFDF